MIGFSTAGKTTFAEAVRRTRPEVETMDSDAYISADVDAHIFNLFLAHGRDRALEIITEREERFLDGLEQATKPQLIAAGPGLPLRDRAWAAFLERVNPQLVLVHVTPHDALAGLRHRREQHLSRTELGRHPHFGSWDQGVTTFRGEDGRWQPHDDDTALRNVASEHASHHRHYYRNALTTTIDGGALARDPDHQLAVTMTLSHLLATSHDDGRST